MELKLYFINEMIIEVIVMGLSLSMEIMFHCPCQIHCWN